MCIILFYGDIYIIYCEEIISVTTFFNSSQFCQRGWIVIYLKSDRLNWPSLPICCAIYFAHFSIPKFKGRNKQGQRKCYQPRKYKCGKSYISPTTTTTHPNGNRNQNIHIFGDIDSGSRNRCNDIKSNDCAHF